jgi:hypothetical protein
MPQHADLGVGGCMTDAERLDWLEEQARKSPTGISFDFVPRCEGDPAGWRFMRKHFISNPAKTLREAIDNVAAATL